MSGFHISRDLSCAAFIAALAFCCHAQVATAADIHRHVPSGTLTYTIVLTGHGEATRAAMQFHDITEIHRKVEVTTRMEGHVVNGEAAGPSAGSPMAALQKALEHCGEDAGCQQAAAMNYARHRQAMDNDRERLTSAIGRNTLWKQSAPCQGAASVNDSERLTELSDQLRLTTVSGTRRGTSKFECNGGPALSMDDSATLLADPLPHTYTLSLPGFSVRSTVTATGGQPPRTEKAGGPSIKIRNVKFTSLDVPQTGKRKIKAFVTEGRSPAYSRPLTIPVDAEVTWTFKPDPK